jgi:hypothetical protein
MDTKHEQVKESYQPVFNFGHKKKKRPTPPKNYKPTKPSMNYLLTDTTFKILERVPSQYHQRLLNMELERQLRAYEKIVANPEEKLKNKSKYGLNIKNKLKYDWKKMLDKLIRQDNFNSSGEHKEVIKKDLVKNSPVYTTPVYTTPVYTTLSLVSSPSTNVNKEVIPENKQEINKEIPETKQEIKEKPKKIKVYKKTGLPLPPPKDKKLWIRGIPKPLVGTFINYDPNPHIEFKGITAEQKNIKNPIFIKNVVDPLSGKVMEEILCHKIMKPTQFKEYREKWDLVWQYYRDRHKRSVEETYIKFNKSLLQLKFLNDDTVYYLDRRDQRTKETYLKFLNDPNYTEQRHAEKSLPENWGKPKPPPLMPPPKKGEVKRIKMMKRMLLKENLEDPNTIMEIKAILTKVPIIESDVDLALQKKNIEPESVEKLKYIIKNIIPDPIPELAPK